MQHEFAHHQQLNFWHVTGHELGSPNGGPLTQQEALRTEMLRKSQQAANKSSQRLSMYQTRSLARKPEPLDPDQLLKDSRVQVRRYGMGGR
jgi:hypothetical protein